MGEKPAAVTPSEDSTVAQARRRLSAASASEPLLYLAIARDLREQIMVGTFPTGGRLPSETELAAQYGVARTSVREALRVLVAQGLIATTRGATGGSTVLELNHRDVMRMLEQNMHYLVSIRGCTREEMEEARELLEVTATWMAASRRTPVQVQSLFDCIPDIAPGSAPTREQIDTNLRFHYEILEATGNRLLHLFAEPVAIVIYSFYRSDEHDPDYYQDVLSEHRAIARAIENRDADRARELMTAHIRQLRAPDGGPKSSLSGLRFD